MSNLNVIEFLTDVIKKLKPIYYYAYLACILPIFFFFISALMTIKLNDITMTISILSLELMLLSLLPCGLIGIILNTIGIVKSYKYEDKLNVIIGIIGIVISFMLVIIGFDIFYSGYASL